VIAGDERDCSKASGSCAEKGDSVIRQAISCDICASEKKQTNHWFVAHEQNGELRVAGWNSRNRLRPGTKHLCGQICLHKLVDEFMARTIAVRAQAGGADETGQQVAGTDASLTSEAAYAEPEPPPRLIAQPPTPVPTIASLRAQPELLAVPGRVHVEEKLPLPEDAPRFASRNWRAEAWERERERELRAVERRPDARSRRRSGT
jgi:hypothetical protein